MEGNECGKREYGSSYQCTLCQRVSLKRASFEILFEEEEVERGEEDDTNMETDKASQAFLKVY